MKSAIPIAILILFNSMTCAAEKEEINRYNDLTLTLNLENAPLGQIIRYIASGLGLAYRIEAHAVIIASPHALGAETTETRFYAVTKEFGDILPTNDNDKLRKFLITLGIPMGEKAQIQYLPKLNRLIATNTQYNLAKVEQLINQLDLWTIQRDIANKNLKVDEYPTIVQLGNSGQIFHKLKSIIIPKVTYTETPIIKVIKDLRKKSKELDPEGNGISIFLQLGDCCECTYESDSDYEDFELIEESNDFDQKRSTE